jgi:hypothetical protein
MTEKKSPGTDPRHPATPADPRHGAAAIGGDVTPPGQRTDQSHDAVQARSTAAFEAARDAGAPSSSRDLQGTPSDDALRVVREALQNLADDSSRRRVLREAAQSCGIDITTLAADPAAPNSSAR